MITQFYLLKCLFALGSFFLKWSSFLIFGVYNFSYTDILCVVYCFIFAFRCAIPYYIHLFTECFCWTVRSLYFRCDPFSLVSFAFLLRFTSLFNFPSLCSVSFLRFDTTILLALFCLWFHEFSWTILFLSISFLVSFVFRLPLSCFIFLRFLLL